MYEQPTIEVLDTSSAICILRDRRGNLMGVGTPDVLGILLSLSKRCAEPGANPELSNRKKDKLVSIQ